MCLQQIITKKSETKVDIPSQAKGKRYLGGKKVLPQVRVFIEE